MHLNSSNSVLKDWYFTAWPLTYYSTSCLHIQFSLVYFSRVHYAFFSYADSIKYESSACTVYIHHYGWQSITGQQSESELITFLVKCVITALTESRLAVLIISLTASPFRILTFLWKTCGLL